MKSWENHQSGVFEKNSTKEVLTDPIQRERVDFLLNCIGKDKNVLDIGSNHGHIPEEVRKKGNTVWAFDLPKVMEIGMKKNPKLHWQSGSAEDKLNYSNDFFDVVIAGEIIEHLINIDNFFDEAYRILKPGGMILVTTPNVARPVNAIQILIGDYVGGFYLDEEKPMHIRFYTARTLRDRILKHGFRELSLTGARTGNDSYDGSLFTKEEKLALSNIFKRFRKSKAEISSILCLRAFKPKEK